MRPFVATTLASGASTIAIGFGIHQQPLFPGRESWPEERHPERAVCEPDLPFGEAANEPSLRGVLLKRHGTLPAFRSQKHTATPRWAKRFVAIDDCKGRLSYCHKEGGKPRVALPLQDVTRVRALPAAGDGRPHAFEIDCPPHQLVLQADEAAHCQRWVDALERRVQHWRRKAAIEGPRTAVPVLDSRPGTAGPHWRMEQEWRPAW